MSTKNELRQRVRKPLAVRDKVAYRWDYLMLVMDRRSAERNAALRGEVTEVATRLDGSQIAMVSWSDGNHGIHAAWALEEVPA